MMVYHGSSAFDGWRGSFCDLKSEVLRAVRTFEKRPDLLKKRPVLVVTGVSGMALGFPLADKLGLDIAVLRKPDEDSHGVAGTFVGVSLKRRVCVFVDDFVSGGATRRRVRNAVYTEGGTMPWQYTSREDVIDTVPA